jgi:hypothetical protein
MLIEVQILCHASSCFSRPEVPFAKNRGCSGINGKYANEGKGVIVYACLRRQKTDLFRHPTSITSGRLGHPSSLAKEVELRVQLYRLPALSVWYKEVLGKPGKLRDLDGIV